MFVLKLLVKFQRPSSLSIGICRAKSTSVLTSLLDIPSKRVKDFKVKHGLQNIDEEDIQDVIEFCESFNISKEDIKENGKLLKVKAHALDSQYTLLKEIGITKIDAGILFKYRTCMNRPISLLKAYELIPEDANVAANLASYLKPKPTNFKIDDLSDEHVPFEVHKTLLVRYLSWKLNLTEEEIEKSLRQKKMQGIRSFRFLCEMLALAADLGIQEERLLHYGHILAGYPKNVLTTITQTPDICGVKMTTLYQKYPKLVKVNAKRILELKQILEHNNIKGKTIINSSGILMLSPTTVKLRFQELNEIPELRVLRNNPRTLNLITYHNRVRSRLSFLQNIKLQCTSLVRLDVKLDTFDSYVKQGTDKNSIYELKLLLQHLLETDYKEFETNLRKHPFFLKVPLHQIQDTFQYLKTERIETSSIIKVVPILLYPKEKIKRAFKTTYDDIRLRFSPLSEVQRLNLALYFMEKRHHFTGDGIWRSD